MVCPTASEPLYVRTYGSEILVIVSGIFDVHQLSIVTYVVFGRSSVMVILLIGSGPLFVTAIVNFASSPG